MKQRGLCIGLLLVVVLHSATGSPAVDPVLGGGAPEGHYAAFDFAGCRHGAADGEAELSPAGRMLLHDTATHLSCAHFCGTHNYPYGGCDCLSGKCKCATKDMDFCSLDGGGGAAKMLPAGKLLNPPDK